MIWCGESGTEEISFLEYIICVSFMKNFVYIVQLSRRIINGCNWTMEFHLYIFERNFDKCPTKCPTPLDLE